ncbi:hypothetical protein [Neobacillus sp. FSL H8-0543]
MLDYMRRLLIVAIMALCVSLLFLGGKPAKAQTDDINMETRAEIY